MKQAKVDYYHNVLNDKNNYKKSKERNKKNSGPTKILSDTSCTITDP